MIFDSGEYGLSTKCDYCNKTNMIVYIRNHQYNLCLSCTEQILERGQMKFRQS